MKFLRLHQKGKPLLIDVKTINQIHLPAKGGGSFIVTDDDEHNLEVDESQEMLIQYLTEIDIEVEFVANDL